MIDDLRAMAVFAETIKQGSFRGAAKQLGLSPSVVSYHVTQLEQRVGTALIYRSTRKLSLTHEGETLYHHAQQMLHSAEQGLSKVTADGEEISGKLTITLLAGMARSALNQKIAQFCRLHPNLKLNMIYTDVRQDLIADGIDLAIRSGELTDSSLKARKIGQIERILVCSPEYLATQQTPKQPQDLAEWHWIKLAMLPATRTLFQTGQKAQDIHFKSNISVNSVEAMNQLTIHGLGVSTPPVFLAEQEIKNGNLIELLPDWHVEPLPLYAIWPGNVSASSATRRMLDYLVEG